MILSSEQEKVLRTIVELSGGDRTVPVTIGAIHGTFSDMDVRDLVENLKELLKSGFIVNEKPAPEGISNSYLLTAEGIRYYNQS